MGTFIWPILILGLVGTSTCLNIVKWVNELDKKQDYNKLVPPGYAQNKTTEVQVQLYMETLGNFRPVTMDFDADVYLIEMWVDERLRHNHSTYISINDRPLLRRIWLPDLYFSNSRKASINDVIVPNTAMKIYNNGTIRYSMRVSLKLSCNMDLKAYPMDKQLCAIRILSYSNRLHVVHVTWTDEYAVMLNPDIMESDFGIDRDRIEANYCNGTKLAGRKPTASCLIACVYLKRFIGYSAVRTYIPSIIIVAVSWISFWLDPDSVPGRVAILITTLLVQATRAVASQFTLPAVAYVKAQDVWFGICVLSHFAALVEFAVVNTMSRMSREVTFMTTVHRKPGEQVPEKKEDDSPAESGRKLVVSYKKKALAIDRICRLAFPIAFTALSIIYWCYYLTLSPPLVPD